jgi:hypothetical protein
MKEPGMNNFSCSKMNKQIVLQHQFLVVCGLWTVVALFESSDTNGSCIAFISTNCGLNSVLGCCLHCEKCSLMSNWLCCGLTEVLGCKESLTCCRIIYSTAEANPALTDISLRVVNYFQTFLEISFFFVQTRCFNWYNLIGWWWRR